MPFQLVENSIFKLIRKVIPPDVKAYLVGGSVRDYLMGRPFVDYDFTLSERPLFFARKIADELKGAYYPLDIDRQTGRVLWKDEHGKRLRLDFALQRSDTLEEDLYQRDYSVNAIAVDIRQPEALIDPLNGVQDVVRKVLRQCSPQAFSDDPLRIVRGVRLAISLGFRIEPETWHNMVKSVTLLSAISAERMRDELYHILLGKKVASALHLLDKLGALTDIFPELAALKGVEQSPPHRYDVFLHTLDVVQKLEELLMVLSENPDEEKWQANLISGMASHRLGRYRKEITDFMDEELVIERPRGGLLMLAAMYHDAGKRATQSTDETGRIRFFGHEELGQKLVFSRMQSLAFARSEIDEVATIVFSHMRPIQLAMDEHQPSARAIYRYFRDTGIAGVGAAILSLADILGVYGYTITVPVWQKQLDIVRNLLEAWWERTQQTIRPPALINGNEIMRELDLSPGPQIGVILEAVREGQVSGEISTREDALNLARKIITQG